MKININTKIISDLFILRTNSKDKFKHLDTAKMKSRLVLYKRICAALDESSLSAEPQGLTIDQT